MTVDRHGNMHHPQTGRFVHKTRSRERTFTQAARQLSAARARERHDAIKDVADLVRGGRQPRNRAEEQRLHWASPKKMAEQRTLTGDTRMPRTEAMRREVGMLRQGLSGGFGYRDPRTDVVRQPFTGKWTVVRGRLRSYFDDKGQMQIEKRVRRQPFRRAGARRAGY